jgi:uncharacterized protein
MADPFDKCGRCKGSICCSYVTQRIPGPRSIADFDFLLWQVSHHGVSVFQADDGWYLQFEARCAHLQPDRRCGIYASRPQICRDYKNDWCEFDEPASKHYQHHFQTHAELDAYCRKRFKRWDARHRDAAA